MGAGLGEGPGRRKHTSGGGDSLTSPAGIVLALLSLAAGAGGEAGKTIELSLESEDRSYMEVLILNRERMLI